MPFAGIPSGVKAGAGNDSQSTSSQESRDQSADQTLTRRSALTASHSCDPAMSPAPQPCMNTVSKHYIVTLTASHSCDPAMFNCSTTLCFRHTCYDTGFYVQHKDVTSKVDALTPTTSAQRTQQTNKDMPHHDVHQQKNH